nr:MAG TPA: E3 ubiquitin-protein ligase [Caudoviricetes sp.]
MVIQLSPSCTVCNSQLIVNCWEKHYEYTIS